MGTGQMLRGCGDLLALTNGKLRKTIRAASNLGIARLQSLDRSHCRWQIL